MSTTARVFLVCGVPVRLADLCIGTVAGSPSRRDCPVPPGLACDLGVVLRDWCEQLTAGDPVSLARRHWRLLAGSTGVSEAAIGERGFLERVSSGLYIWSLGAADLAGPFLATAQMPMLPTSARRP